MARRRADLSPRGTLVPQFVREDEEGAAGCVRAQTMKRYRPRLPHWDIPEAPVFVTWRLWGSLPQERSFLPEHLTSGEAFVALDRLLDSTRMGPVYLRQDKIAGIVRDHLQALVADGLCSLDAYVVMPN